jgi:hypothetical protein
MEKQGKEIELTNGRGTPEEAHPRWCGNTEKRGGS